ncbi:hypothetical protein [Gracilibacillus phocaeensis]|uniref:hypothetical protein n=1 Tax=Gracilibacillus phocaeensis TaxID=2042304 RepID=UPI001031D224|nr:hypothetical protein [Gracilibacillus phocaeensis]
MERSKFVLFFSVLWCLGLLSQVFFYWRADNYLFLIVTATVFILILSFIIGYLTKRSFWLMFGLVCYGLSALYTIVAVFWLLFLHELNMMLTVGLAVSLLIDILMMIRLQKQRNQLKGPKLLFSS